MSNFFEKIKDLADQHDEKVDAALEKIGDEADRRTDGKYSEHIEKGVDAAQQHTGDGDTTQR
jgi:hypothetical protein